MKVIKISVLSGAIALLMQVNSLPGLGVNVPRERKPIAIEQVQVIILKSFPARVNLGITGYLQDGCRVPVQVEQRREGNRVTVQIYRQLAPGTICPAVIVPYQKTIPINGVFPPGNYQFRVNDQTLQQQI